MIWGWRGRRAREQPPTEPIVAPPDDPDVALRQARAVAAEVAAAARRAEPVLARLEAHLSTNHVYDAVMATILDGR